MNIFQKIKDKWIDFKLEQRRKKIRRKIAKREQKSG